MDDRSFARRARTLAWLFALALLLPSLVPAGAGAETLPAPKLTGPDEISSPQPFQLQLKYQYPASAKPFSLWFWAEYWYCPPGKDSAPTNTQAEVEPWPGSPCKTDLNGKLGLDPAKSSEEVLVPKYSGVKADAGTWYVRARFDWDGHGKGPWGPWHRTKVDAPPGAHTTLSPMKPSQLGFKKKGLNPKVFTMGLKPPTITAPKEGQTFHGTDVTIAVSLPDHGSHSADWELMLEWQRARIATQENNDWVKAHTPKGQTPVYEFPSTRDPWPEGPMSGIAKFAVSFSQLRPHSHKFGYEYWFRVREHHKPSGANGPWSPWRSFIVQESIQFALPPGGFPVPAGSQNKPGSGQSQEKQLLPSAQKLEPTTPVHRLKMRVPTRITP